MKKIMKVSEKGRSSIVPGKKISRSKPTKAPKANVKVSKGYSVSGKKAK